MTFSADNDRRFVLSVIIARAGSRGLPGKNALTLAGRPMISYTIAHSEAARYVSQTIVSTDCPKVAAAATALDVPVIDRPEHLADDRATVDSAVRHAVEGYEQAIGDRVFAIAILYGNVPVRPHGLIDAAIEQLLATDADSVQSYSPVGKFHPWWMVRLNDVGEVTPYEQHHVYRRQDLPELFIPDGGLIAVTRSSLFVVDDNDPHAFLGSDRRGIISTGPVVDIDTADDLQRAESIVARMKNQTVELAESTS